MTRIGRCQIKTHNLVTHYKLGMSDRNRDNVGKSRKHVQEIIADNLSKAGWSWGCRCSD
jgi:hypothetical protein